MDTYKFSLSLYYDHLEDEVIVGYCNNVLGLNAAYKVEDELDTYIIECIEFELNEKMYDVKIKKEKFDISGYISVLDNNSKTIGEYSFSIKKEITFCDIEKGSLEKKLTLFVSLGKLMVGNELILWDYWRGNEIKEKNQWIHLSEIDKSAWLNIALNRPKNYNTFDDIVQGGTYYLDCTYITSVEAFFCALGETLIGPGGYYGFDYINIIDCLTGGFKVTYPFTIVFKNAEIALNNLTNEAWKEAEEREAMCYLDCESDDDPDEEPYVFNHKGSFIDKILEVFVQYSVTVILEPKSREK